MTGTYDPAASPPRFPDLRGHVKATQLSIATPTMAAPIEDGQLSLLLAPGSATLENLSARIGKSDIACSGNVTQIQGLYSPVGRPSLDIALSSALLDLDEMLAAPEEIGAFSFTTPLYAAESEPGSISTLANLIDVTGSATVDKLVSGGVLTDVGATVKLLSGHLKVDDLQAKAYGGRIEGAFEADFASQTEKIPTKMRVALLGGQADGVLQNFFNLPLPIVGKMGLKLSGGADLDSALTLIPGSLDLEGLADLADGEIRNWDWLKASTQKVDQLGFFDFDSVPIKNLATHIQVEQDRVFTRNLRMSASGIPVELDGSVGLSDHSLDYTVLMDIPADKLSVGGLNVGEALGSLLGGGNATIPLELKIGGTASSPALTTTLRQSPPGGGTKQESLKERGKSLLRRFR